VLRHQRLTMAAMRVRHAFAAVVLVAAGCGSDAPAAPTVPGDAAWTTIATVDGATLSRLSLSDGSHVYRQQVDLRRMRIEQAIGDRDPGVAAEAGRYFPGGASPRFLRIPPVRAQDTCRSDLFSVVNFAFFEE